MSENTKIKIDWSSERPKLKQMIKDGLDIKEIGLKYGKKAKQMQIILSRQKISVRNLRKQIQIEKDLKNYI